MCLSPYSCKLQGLCHNVGFQLYACYCIKCQQKEGLETAERPRMQDQHWSDRLCMHVSCFKVNPVWHNSDRQSVTCPGNQCNVTLSQGIFKLCLVSAPTPVADLHCQLYTCVLQKIIRCIKSWFLTVIFGSTKPTVNTHYNYRYYLSKKHQWCQVLFVQHTSEISTPKSWHHNNHK